MNNIKNLGMKIAKNLTKKIIIHDVGYVTTNMVKLLFLIINSATGYIEKVNGNKFGTKLKILSGQQVIIQIIMIYKNQIQFRRLFTSKTIYLLKCMT